MKYGTKLKSKNVYAKIFNQIKKQIRTGSFENIRIEHVGGTALTTPSGKGDIDIYIAFQNKKEQKKLFSFLNKIFGKPGKVTENRIRYNKIIEGIEVEIQLTDTKSMEVAVALRDYLNTHSQEARRCAKAVTELWKDFLEKMFQVKKSFSEKAIKVRASESI